MPDTNEIIQLLKRVHQTREFTDQPVPTEALSELLAVARWTGSARNVQPWHFVVIEDRADLEYLAGVGPSAGFFKTAPLVIAVVIDQKSPTPAFDEARVVERLFIAAAALGLSSGIGTFAPTNIPLASARLNLPENLTFHAGVAIGYAAPRTPTANPASPARKPLESIVSYGTYGNHQR